MEPRILVAYDFGRASDAALAWASNLQRSVGGPPIHVVHVLNPVPIGSPEMPMAGPTEEEIAAIRSRLGETVANRQMTATTEVVLAPFVGDALIDLARRLQSDLIVVGTHGRSGLARAFLGSVAHHVVQHAACPVVTVHAAPEARSKAA